MPRLLDERPHNIVIVGAGFGGLYAFRHLYRRYAHDTRVRLTLINPENYFLFTPLLHEVATGGVSPYNVVEPLRKAMSCRESELLIARVEKISLQKKTVITSSVTLPYATLVLAPGSQTNYFDVPGAETYAFGLKTLNDAVRLKNHFIKIFETCASPTCTDNKTLQKLLSFVVVGGGPTGVELVAEMADLFYDTFAFYYNSDALMAHVRIFLIESKGGLISEFSSTMRGKALETLRRKKVDVRLRTRVTRVRADEIALSSGEIIPTATTIWVAGIKPTHISSDISIARDTCDRIVTDPFLRIPGNENVYLIGDAALCFDGQHPLPATAQVAVQQAYAAAENIIRDIEGGAPKPLIYRHRGNLISVGKWMALAEIGTYHFGGRIAWWIWRTVYLSKFISWNKKIDVAVDWTLSIFAHRDITRL